MSSKKIDYRKFFRLRKMIGEHEAIGPFAYYGFPLNLKDFNNVLYGSRNVLIEFPTYNRTYMDFAAMYLAMRMAFQGTNAKVFCTMSDLVFMIDDYYESIVPKTLHRKKDDRLLCTGFGHISWTSVTDSFNDYMFSLSDVSGDGFDEGMDKLRIVTDTIETYRHTTPKRVIVLYPHSVSGNNDKFSIELDKFKKEYADSFLFIDYTKEREVVDLWMNKESFMDVGFLDPEFDMKLATPGLNLNYVFNYMAIGFPASFKDYARLNEEYVSQYMRKEDLRNFIKPIKYGKPYGKVKGIAS